MSSAKSRQREITRNIYLFLSCQINDRQWGDFETPGINEPLMGVLEEVIMGKLMWQECADFSVQDMYGTFRWPFVVMTNAMDPEAYRYLDLYCHGGSEKNKAVTP